MKKNNGWYQLEGKPPSPNNQQLGKTVLKSLLLVGRNGQQQVLIKCRNQSYLTKKMAALKPSSKG
ncbi:hypothetical protein AS888_22070 [Peribacillus simplex]|uniref:Uncharacterized protein n=1 Tax=Peribacillus simplex TaxID=1478 RepID=A0A120GP34_9BACI|nr:hypothetical protein [Peribacillus simplex]KWW17297.1 hypothetical protein AS888_22070 [Peribacillus simplex]